MLSKRTFLAGGCNMIETIFSQQGSHHFNYSIMSSHRSFNNQDARTKSLTFVVGK
jgi:hypothetical protein